MNYIQYMKPGSKFWSLPNGLEDVSWSEFWSNWKKAIAKAKEQIVDNWESLKQDYKDAADPIAASERKQAESIEATRAKQASMKFVSDNRTDYEKKRDRKNFKLKEFEQKDQLNKDATDAVMWTLTGIPYAVQHLASPNGVVKTYGNTKAAVQNGGGPYLEKAVASAAGDVLDAAILTAPLFTPEAQLARQLNKNIKEGVQLGQYYHGSPNRSIAQFKVGKDGGIYFTPSKDAAKLYTGLFGTGKVYNANLNIGDNVVTIDNGGRPWTKIPEEVVAKEFGITKQQVHDIIGSYNLGETPWHYGLTKHFGYRPKNNYYAIDLVVRLGKDLGVTGLVIQNARDNGKRLFSKNIPYDQTIVFDPKLITLNPLHAADEAVLRGQLGWAPKQTIPYRHGSLDPELQTFVPKHDRWDVVTHGADPNMYFVTDQTTPVSAANMMDLRPYQYTGSIVAEKPMVQVGDFNIAGKNATRNQLIARARQQGADTYLLQDIVDNKVPHLNIVARFIGPEGEAVQGGAASVEWYGPTMGKTTAAKVSDKLVDIDPLLKPIRAKHAERLGLKISDPKVSADPLYKQEVADFVLEWRANPENQGKTLVASTKHLLDPQYKIEFANEPSIPDFETFAARNKARGFKETDEQLRAWYNSIFELGRDLKTDNRFVSDIKGSPLKGYTYDEVTGEFIPDAATEADLIENALRMINREATSAQLGAAEYFGSPNYLRIISRRGGGGDENLARAISDAKQFEVLNAEIEAANLGRTSERLQGTNKRVAGLPSKTTLNIDELATPELGRETVYHETGGHGASANIEHKRASWMNDAAAANNEALKEENPVLALVAEHNAKYRPTEKDLSELGKALRDGDIPKLLTMKEWAGEITDPKLAKEFAAYLMDEDGGMQEIAARVNANRIAKFQGEKNTWNETQLKIFTPEYRRKISRYLWSLFPFSVTASLVAASGASTQNSEDTQQHKQGGKLNYLNLFK